MKIMNSFSFSPSRAHFYSILIVGLLASKLLHLFVHASSVSLLSFILYLPTFFIQDCLVAIIARLLLHQGTGLLALVGSLIGGFLALLTIGAASAQLGFYYVTGGEIEWDATSSVAGDPAAVRLLMSGIWPVSLSAVILLSTTLLITPSLYNKVGNWLRVVWKFVEPRNWRMILPFVRTKAVTESSLEAVESLLQTSPEKSQTKSIRLWPLCALMGVVTLVVLDLIRPAVPYDHISTTLPVALTRIFYSSDDPCANQFLPFADTFPLEELITNDLWEIPHDNFKGWAPGADNLFVKQYAERRPEWLSNPLPDGFYRWESQDHQSRNTTVSATDNSEAGKTKCPIVEKSYHYNPVSDPLRISNLDLEPYDALQEAFRNNSAIISHIVLVMMESTRKDLFPIIEGSYMYNVFLESHGDKKDVEKLNANFARMTRVAEQVTGESFSEGQAPVKVPGEWQDSAAPGMGGINVKGALTGSTLSFKSVLGSHCGVGPLPEDFLEEVTTKIYQPCIPQLLNLFNKHKEASLPDSRTPNMETDYRSTVHKRMWESAFVQSITDRYDRQNELNEQMNFGQSISKEILQGPSAKYPPTDEEINYFGYAESQVKPYIHDMISNAVKNNTRLFLSHFTSTTHHPWKSPDGFNLTDYMGSGDGKKHDHMNSYLNTVHYDDTWLGEILTMLDDAGIANETLVVLVGDHGQAFEEDSEKTGTYENGHISNFRVPLVFRHPHLPRVHVSANATSMSIIPTILDLLINTNSLDALDTAAAADLIHDYEGQSLLRPYKSSYKGRQAWNFGIINAGGALLSISSAAVPYRVVIPLHGDFQFRFTHLEKDPNELHPLQGWTLQDLMARVRQVYGMEAAKWIGEADKVGRWWSKERHRLYHYTGK